MAAVKKKANAEDIEENMEEIGTGVEEVAEDIIDEAEEPVTVPTEEVIDPKLVSIIPNIDMNFYHGDTWYTIKKDKETKVPFEIKRRLLSMGALKVI